MTHLLVVLSNARPDREHEFNDWYDAVHVHEMVDTLEGYESAQRFVRQELDDVPPQPYKYLTIYEVEDLELAHAQFRFQRRERVEAEAAGRAPLVAGSTAMAADALVGFFSAIGPRVTPEAALCPPPQTSKGDTHGPPSAAAGRA